MNYEFRKHYTREEARALLPQARQWLERLDSLRLRLEELELRVQSIMSSGGDSGGDTINQWIRTMADIRHVLEEFQKREILVKDIERGLLDFPAIIGGREVFLCWEKHEDDIEFWHDIDGGYAGRAKI